ncbi:MAG: hypothetical protein SFX73_28065 [Kofleriaceae bacterium]|nr:hypothetical protein [Kofleriaceae bacterium]
MGFLDKVNNLREKANRLGLDEDVDQRNKDRNDEARKRLDAGRKTLTAILEGGPDAVVTQVSQHSGAGEAVGKITQVMAAAAPTLQANAPAVKQVIDQIDSAKNQLANHGAKIADATTGVESAMTNLVAQTNMATALPTNLVADLTADAVHDNTPKTTANEENANATDVAAQTGTTVADTSVTKKRRKKKLADLAAQVKPTGTGRPKLRDLAGNTGFLDKIGAPSNVTALIQEPTNAVQNATNTVTNNVQQAVDGAVNDATAPVRTVTGDVNNVLDVAQRGGSGGGGGGFGRMLGGLGVLGGVGSGIEKGPISLSRDGVTVSKDLGGGTEGSVTLGPEGVSLDGSRDIGGGNTGTVGVTLGEEGPSVHGEVSRETSLGKATAGVELGADGSSVYGELEGGDGFAEVSVGSDGGEAEG